MQGGRGGLGLHTVQLGVVGLCAWRVKGQLRKSEAGRASHEGTGVGCAWFLCTPSERCRPEEAASVGQVAERGAVGSAG